MELANKTIKGLAWTTLDKWVSRIISTCVLAILARLLRPEDFGLVALAASFAGFAEVVANQGLGFAIMMRPKVGPREFNAAFWANVVCFGVGAIILFSVALGMVLLYPEKREVGFVLQGMALVLVIDSLSRIQASILTRELKFKGLAIRSLLATSAGGVTGVALAYSGAGAMSIIGQQIVSAIVGLIVLWRASEWRPSWEFSWDAFKEVYSYGYKIFLDRVVLYARDNIDIFLIGSVAGLAGLGFYSVAKRVIDLLCSLFISSLTVVLYPAFSQAQNDLPRLLGGLYRAVRLTSLVVTPLFFGVLVMGPEAIRIVAGAKWDTAIPMVRVLALAYAFSWMDPFVSGILHARQRSGSVVIIHAIGAVTSVVAVLFGSLWGVMGIVVAVSVRRLIGTATQLKFTQKFVPELSIKEIVKGIWIPLVASIIMTGITWWGLSYCVQPLVRTLVGPTLGIIVYILAFWAISMLVGASTHQELITMIKNFLKKRHQASVPMAAPPNQ